MVKHHQQEHLIQHIQATTNNVVFNSGYSVPEIDHDSGDVLYVENRAPITRAQTRQRISS